MSRLSRFLLITLACILPVGVYAQGASPVCSQSAGKSQNLYCLPILSTESAFLVPSAGLENFVGRPGFTSFNSAFGSQLTQLPTPNPASGLIFTFGPGGLSSQRELGPIFSEAPWTTGRHKVSVAFTYEYFYFNKIDDVSFNEIPLQLNGCLGSCSSPLIQTTSQYHVSLNEYTAYASFGLTSRIDVSVAIPILDVRTSMTTTCSICSQQTNVASPSATTPFYILGFQPNTTEGSSSGLGDLLFRVKWNAVPFEKTGLAVGVDVRAPTGDAYNLRGAGTVGVRPFAAFGYRARLSPHLNIGYVINGNSILASSDGLTPQHLPNSLNYSGGIDFSVVRRVSVSADILGQTFFDGTSVFIGPSQSGTTLFSTKGTFNTNAAGFGFKLNPVEHLLISGNVLLSLDYNGLHYSPSPMIGVSYTF
jgi:hypothetical protein